MGRSSLVLTEDVSPLAIRMADAKVTDKELADKGASLKKAETKEASSGVDAAVLAAYKNAWENNAGDKDKICAALGLDTAKWSSDIDSVDKFCMKYLGAK